MTMTMKTIRAIGSDESKTQDTDHIVVLINMSNEKNKVVEIAFDFKKIE